MEDVRVDITASGSEDECFQWKLDERIPQGSDSDRPGRQVGMIRCSCTCPVQTLVLLAISRRCAAPVLPTRQLPANLRGPWQNQQGRVGRLRQSNEFLFFFTICQAISSTPLILQFSDLS